MEPPRRPNRGGRGQGGSQSRGRGGSSDGGRGRGRSGGSRGGPEGGRGRGGYQGGRGGGGRGGGGRGGGGARGKEISMQQAMQRYKNDMSVGDLDADPPTAGAQEVPRPGFGKVGEATRLLTNHFDMKCGVHKAFQYDVIAYGMKPDKAAAKPGERAPLRVDLPPQGEPPKQLPAKLCQIALAKFLDKEGSIAGWVYDGWKCLYAKNKLPDSCLGKPTVIEFNEPGDTARISYQVEVRFISQIDISNHEDRNSISVMDSVLKQAYATDPASWIQGRSIYTSAEARFIDPVLEIRNGVSQAVRNCQGGLQFILDTKAAAFFPASPVLDVIQHVARWNGDQQELSKRGFDDLEATLKGLMIQVTQPFKRKYKVKGILKSSEKQTFLLNGEKCTVLQYFIETGRTVKYPKLPCVDVSLSNSRPCYIPAEFCSVVAEKKKSEKSSQRESTAVIQAAAAKPDKRMRMIQANVRDMSKKFLSEFKIGISKQGKEIKARVLPSPALEYGQKKYIDVGKDGFWNIMNSKFYEGGKLDSWAVACVDNQQETVSGVRRFVPQLVAKMRAMGMDVVDDPPVAVMKRNQVVEDVIDAAFDGAQKKFKSRPKMILAVLRDKTNLKPPESRNKADVKMRCDSDLGVVSQVMLSAKSRLAGGVNDQYCTNITLKINKKLGGKNCRIPSAVIQKFCGVENVMFMGADVTHPARKEGQSIAAVVGSMDADNCQYAACDLFLPSRNEMINSLDEAVASLVNMYQARNGHRPDAIIFYRDGIADNQFAECREKEIPKIQQGCSKVDPNYQPLVTFIVVQKRHLTRFEPLDNKKDKSGNILPGTVVDTDICHPHAFDFYLNSHAGILGTSKAAHYHVLQDEIGFGADGAQLLTNYLCYLYARCTRAVSYCPPAYYAHLAAARARELNPDYVGQVQNQIVSINPALASSMHFI
ncbi:hypothetical protein BSKO_10024 [Bryopsis sp. KO-2023]|nr:hypothetical protein BSKO_10024 [Bryopsis sp. KO-2023]